MKLLIFFSWAMKPFRYTNFMAMLKVHGSTKPFFSLASIILDFGRCNRAFAENKQILFPVIGKILFLSVVVDFFYMPACVSCTYFFALLSTFFEWDLESSVFPPFSGHVMYARNS